MKYNKISNFFELDMDDFEEIFYIFQDNFDKKN